MGDFCCQTYECLPDFITGVAKKVGVAAKLS